MRSHVVRIALVAALVGCVPLVNAGKPTGGGTVSSYTGRNLGVLSGDAYSRGNGVSDVGSVVGASSHFVTVNGRTTTFTRAFYWSPGTGLLALPTNVTPDGTEPQSVASAIAGGVTGAEFAVGYEDPAGVPRHAVIWTFPPNSRAVPLEDDLSVWSAAEGVNDDGIAVGSWGNQAAIWVPDASEADGYRRTAFMFVSGMRATATDVNLQGVVVGYSDPGDSSQPQAFVRLAGGNVVPLPPVPGDENGAALAVSDEFAMTVEGLAVNAVYAAGWTQSANGVQRAVRWTVNVETGAVHATTLLTKVWATGVNSDGDVLCNYGQGIKPPSLFRNATYYSLKPPKGATGASASALAGAASSTTYATGVAYGQQANSERAVVWTIR